MAAFRGIRGHQRPARDIDLRGLERHLRRLEKIQRGFARKSIEKIIRASVNFAVLPEARRLTPVSGRKRKVSNKSGRRESGLLRRSISVRKAGRGRSPKLFGVTIGFRNRFFKRKGLPFNYGWAVERGRTARAPFPGRFFMRKAFDATAGRAKTMILGELHSLLKRSGR